MVRGMYSKEEIYFKQLNVCDNFEVRDCQLTNAHIETTNAKCQVISSKMIDTIEGVSLEGQVLTGKKLVIVGSISIRIFVHFPRKAQCGYWIQRELPFSTFIIVPCDVCDEEEIHIKNTIEDVTTVVITRGRIFVNAILLLEYQDEY